MRIILAFLLVILIDTAYAKDSRVNLYCWSSYISPQTISEFEKKYGIRLHYDVFDSNEMLDAKLLAGKTGYDIVCPSDTPFLKNQIRLDIYTKLDKTKLPNFKNIDPFFLKMMSDEDPGNQYALPWLWGTTGIGMNKKRILEIDPNAPIDSLEIIFNPKYAKKFAKCGINFLDSANEVVSLALIYNGLDPNSSDPADLDKAKETLLKIRPYIKTFNSSTYDDSFVDNSLCLGISWSGDIVKAEQKIEQLGKKSNFVFVLPKEGFLMGTDTMAIPNDAPNVENAYIFLNYIMNPKVAAHNSNFTRYFNANITSYKYLDSTMKANKPGDEVIKKGYRINPREGKILRKINRIWMGVITENN